MLRKPGKNTQEENKASDDMSAESGTENGHHEEKPRPRPTCKNDNNDCDGITAGSGTAVNKTMARNKEFIMPSRKSKDTLFKKVGMWETHG